MTEYDNSFNLLQMDHGKQTTINIYRFKTMCADNPTEVRMIDSHNFIGNMTLIKLDQGSVTGCHVQSKCDTRLTFLNIQPGHTG